MVSPMLCRDGALPDGSGWVGEPKLDGYRALVRTGPQGVAITSRQGRSLTHRFPELAGLVEAPPALLDGELVVYDADGRPDFHALARRPGERTACLAVFDVLDVDGRWVGDRPYGQRRELLTSLDLPDGLAQVVTTGPVAAMWQATADLALEGVVAKHLDSAYTPGRRSRWWVRAKHWRTSELLVHGLAFDADGRLDQLLVGTDEDGPTARVELGVARVAAPLLELPATCAARGGAHRVRWLTSRQVVRVRHHGDPARPRDAHCLDLVTPAGSATTRV